MRLLPRLKSRVGSIFKWQFKNLKSHSVAQYVTVVQVKCYKIGTAKCICLGQNVCLRLNLIYIKSCNLIMKPGYIVLNSRHMDVHIAKYFRPGIYDQN